MNRIQQLAKTYGQHIATGVAADRRGFSARHHDRLRQGTGARHPRPQRRVEIASKQANHDWFEVTSRRRSPSGLRRPNTAMPTSNRRRPAAQARIGIHEIRRRQDPRALNREDVTDSSVVAVFGAGALFAFTRVSEVLKLVEPSIRGRLIIFLPRRVRAQQLPPSRRSRRLELPCSANHAR